MKFIPDKKEGRLHSHSMKISQFIHERELSPININYSGGTSGNQLIMG